MKQLTLVLFWFATSAIYAQDEGVQKVVEVNNIQEFIEAIGSHTHIDLQMPILDLSPQFLPDAIENKHVLYDKERKGFTIQDVHNFSISSKFGTNIVTKSGDVSVLSFISSSLIRLNNLDLFHSRDNVSCSGFVLTIEESHNFDLNELQLNGSGSVGLTLKNTENITLNASRIFNNSLAAFSFNHSRNIQILNSLVTENDLYGVISFEYQDNGMSDVHFKNTSFLNNSIAGGFMVHAGDDDRITFTNSNWDGNWFNGQSVDEFYNLLDANKYSALELNKAEFTYRNNLKQAHPKDNVADSSDEGAEAIAEVNTETAKGSSNNKVISQSNVLFFYENQRSWEELKNLFRFPLKKYYDQENLSAKQLKAIYHNSWKSFDYTNSQVKHTSELGSNNLIHVIDFKFIKKYEDYKIQRVRSLVKISFNKKKEIVCVEELGRERLAPLDFKMDADFESEVFKEFYSKQRKNIYDIYIHRAFGGNAQGAPNPTEFLKELNKMPKNHPDFLILYSMINTWARN